MHVEYENFAALAAAHKEGEDFDRVILARPHASAVIIAPHGGQIEPGTDAIAEAIAGADFSLYCFRSRKSRREANLHITSRNFDDPDCVALLKEHRWAVSIHGCRAEGEKVFLGGRDSVLIDALARPLRAAGIPVQTEGHDYPGTDPDNICNRTGTSAGVQFELSRALREGASREAFVEVVRAVLLARQSSLHR